MNIYKVVEVRQKTFTKGHVTTFDLQNVINEWSCSGWILDRILSGETAFLLGSKDVFIIIFRKTFDFPNDLFLMINGQATHITAKDFRVLATNRQIDMNTPSCRKGANDWKPLFEVAPELLDAVLFYTQFI